jgi:arylsulfatase A-like enzyme
VIDEDRLLDTLDEASAAQLIRADTGDSFMFTHDKIRETLYQELIDVPLLIRYPPLFQEAKVVSDDVEMTDVYSTLLDVAGVEEVLDHIEDGQRLHSVVGETFPSLGEGDVPRAGSVRRSRCCRAPP